MTDVIDVATDRRRSNLRAALDLARQDQIQRVALLKVSDARTATLLGEDPYDSLEAVWADTLEELGLPHRHLRGS